MITKIGIFKNGQQFAKEVFASCNIQDVEREFKRMWNETEFCPEGTDNESESADIAWEFKKFSEDTTNVAVFECLNENDLLHTCYCNQGFISNMIR